MIHDGLHRRAAIEAGPALKPELADETISLVLYVDPGFQRSEQIFSDLKRHESRSSRSQGILCDNRDEMALITKELIKRVDAFEGMTEMVRSKISNRSLKLFTLSGIYHATEILLSQQQKAPFAEKLALATRVLDRGGEPDTGLESSQAARDQPGRTAGDLRSFPRDRAVGPGPGREDSSRDRPREMAEEDSHRCGNWTGPGRTGALGREGHGRGPPLQVQHERLARGERHQAATWD